MKVEVLYGSCDSTKTVGCVIAAGATCFDSMMTRVAGLIMVLNNNIMAMCRVRRI